MKVLTTKSQNVAQKKADTLRKQGSKVDIKPVSKGYSVYQYER